MGEKQSYNVRKVKAKNELKTHLEKSSCPAVVCCGPTLNAHWVTLIGMRNCEVYWIDYDGIYRAPLGKFLSITSAGQPLIGDDTLLVDGRTDGMGSSEPSGACSGPPLKKRRTSASSCNSTKPGREVALKKRPVQRLAV